MKALMALPMLFGALAGIDACLLVYYKARIPPDYGPGIVTSLPPNAQMEYFLLGCGAIALALALFQLWKKLRYSGRQVLFSGALTVIGLVFSIRAGIRLTGERSAVYYFVYIALAAAIAVFLTGFVQLVKWYTGDKRAA